MPALLTTPQIYRAAGKEDHARFAVDALAAVALLLLLASLPILLIALAGAADPSAAANATDAGQVLVLPP